MHHHFSRRVELFLMFIVAIVVAMVTSAVYGWYYYDSAGPLTEPKTVVFKKGEGFQEIVDAMGREGVIEQPWLFKAIAAGTGDGRRFKAGEYRFSAAISPRLIIEMIAEGRVVVHKITVPEGYTVRDVEKMLQAESILEGEVAPTVKEGSLLPETYHFVYGDKRQELIERMQNGMATLMGNLWDKRKPGLPFASRDEAITLASIVEKETGLSSERGRVAAVFINRLRKGMKLQSDPTVTYGIEKKTGSKLNRSLVLSDLRTPTAYNTYVIPGLPPGPIANPGKEALEAVLNPPDTNDLYFVATGSGGHNFARTLKEHNENVGKYRAVQQQAAPAPASAAVD